MDQLWLSIVTTACTVLASLLVTFIFNKVAGLPKDIKKQRETTKMKIDSLECSLSNLSDRLFKVEEAVGRYPQYRQQSLEIQEELHKADDSIVELCREIKEDVVVNRKMLDERLKSLEKREKNALRAKILDEYRLYTDEHKNPMQAWSEMEHHSFFRLVEDYEDLGGNDYVHKTILPAMNELDVIKMTDLKRLKDLYTSRQV